MCVVGGVVDQYCVIGDVVGVDVAGVTVIYVVVGCVINLHFVFVITMVTRNDINTTTCCCCGSSAKTYDSPPVFIVCARYADVRNRVDITRFVISITGGGKHVRVVVYTAVVDFAISVVVVVENDVGIVVLLSL